MKKIIIIKTGDTFPAIANQFRDFEDWIFSGLNVDKEKILILDIPRGDILPSVESCKGIVIAGSHDMVTQGLHWSIAIERWIPDVIESNIPLLGICYGHQLIAKAMGGRVDFHIKGLEIGTAQIELVNKDISDRLFKELPKKFPVHACHSQTVVQLPEKAIRIAKNSYEPNHAFRIGDFAWGVQFHPEYDEQIMAAYVENMQTTIKESGLNLSEIMDGIKPTPVALKILKRFGKLLE